jgi:hypothetical protein
MSMPKRSVLIELIQEDCNNKKEKISGLKTKKHSDLVEIAQRRGVFPRKENQDETTEYFKDKDKRRMFIGMYNKDYAENKEKNRLVLEDAKGERINKNTFNHHGIIITYALLMESAEEEDFSTIIKHFNIKVKNGEVTFKM